MNATFQDKKVRLDSRQDKSYKGSIDKFIQPLIEVINAKGNYCTTSSCSGRIILIKETGKKQEKVFIFVSHEKVNAKKITFELNKLKLLKPKEIIYLRHDPCILHVACRTLEDAFWLVEAAKSCGWKKSGVMSKKNNVVELVSTELLVAPVFEKRKILIDKDYLEVLIKEANKKLEQTHTKISSLTKRLS